MDIFAGKLDSLEHVDSYKRIRSRKGQSPLIIALVADVCLSDVACAGAIAGKEMSAPCAEWIATLGQVTREKRKGKERKSDAMSRGPLKTCPSPAIKLTLRTEKKKETRNETNL